MKGIQKQAGFTLIELVVVIVILGILAATAAPKFIDLQDDATTATLEAVTGSMKSAGTMVYSKSLIKGTQDTGPGAGGPGSVLVNGASVSTAFGYPRDNNAAAATSWKDNLLELDANEYTVQRVGGSVDAIVVFPTGKPVPNSIPVDPAAPTALESSCFTYYKEPTAAGESPVVVTVAC